MGSNNVFLLSVDKMIAFCKYPKKTFDLPSTGDLMLPWSVHQCKV